MTQEDFYNKKIIYNKDIAEIKKKKHLSYDDLLLIKFYNSLETNVQQYCRGLFDDLSKEIFLLTQEKLVEFIQIDNGGTSKPSTRKRKRCEGTKEGFPDIEILCANKSKSKLKNIFIEFKRIGTPSQIIIKDKQKDYNQWLSSIGYDAFIINNPLFFKNIILKKIKNFVLS